MPAEAEGPPFTFEVEAAKIRELARALGELAPIHVDRAAARAAGFRDLVAPIGLVVWALVQDRDELFRRFGLDEHGGLAGEEAWDFHGPICAGDVLSGRSRYGDCEKRAGARGPMLLHRFDTEYRNQLDELVLVEHTTIIQWARSPDEPGSTS